MSPTTTTSPRRLTRAFEAANRYLGWGEPQNGLWFVGLEEADGWYDKTGDEVVRLYANLGEVSPATTQLDFATLGAEGRTIRYKTARIMSAVSTSALRLEASQRWRWYHDNKLWRTGSMGFQANLYPLGKPTRAAWPDEFRKLFGFGPPDRDAYKQAVVDTRFPRLYELWTAANPLATICFGKEAWADFKNVFRVTSQARELAGGNIQVYDRERVVLTRFFSRGWVTNAQADAVGALLRDEWNVRIP